MAAQDYEQVTYNGPAGAQMGKSATELNGFWGVTPVTIGSTIAAVDVTVSASVVAASLNLVIAELKRKGLVAT